MKIEQEFTVAQPAAAVWAFFQDVPAVARCLPGAELVEDKGGGTYLGSVSVKLGPFGAAFQGEATVKPDPAARTGHVEGRGVDKKGGSRSRMVLDYRLEDLGASTRVSVDAEVTLSGPIAQFGRTGLIRETSNILVRDFVKNLEARLAATAPPPAAPADAPAPPLPVPQPRPIGGLRLLAAALWSWLRRLLGGRR